MIDHVILTVSDFERSVAFYKKALAALGATECIDYPGSQNHPHLVGFSKRNGNHFFWLKEGRPDPEAIHVGLAAESQEAVDAFYHAAIAAGRVAVQQAYARQQQAAQALGQAATRAAAQQQGRPQEQQQ